MRLRKDRGVEAARTASPGPRGLRLPAIRSGTALEVAEVAWYAAGVSREAALTIPTVAVCRNLVVGTIVQLDPYLFRGDERLDGGALLGQPDPSTTWTATIAGTVDDLLFFGRAYWRVLERSAAGVPVRARWTPYRDVTPETRSTGGSYAELLGYRIAGLRDVVPVDDVIRFDGQAPAILDTGQRMLSAALQRDEAALRFASTELPAGVLTNEGTELGDEEALAIVEGFEAMRHKHGVALLQGVTYERADLNPADLALLESRHNDATDIARLFNVPVALAAASPSGHGSSMTYANLTQQLATLTSTSCAPHIRVLEDVLSNVYPRGQAVAFDVNQYLRSDPAAATENAIALLNANVIDRVEARSMLGIPTNTDGELTPGRV